MKSRIVLLLTDARGIYIPRDFSEFTDWTNISTEDRAIIANPEHTMYWETWDDILANARYTDKEGHVWLLYQEGDLWAIRSDLFDDTDSEEYKGMFGEY